MDEKCSVMCGAAVTTSTSGILTHPLTRRPCQCSCFQSLGALWKIQEKKDPQITADICWTVIPKRIRFV